MKKMLTSLLVVCGAYSTTIFADTATKDVKVSDLSWIDKKYFDKQRVYVDDLGRERFGTRLRQNKTDLHLLQRIIDQQIVGAYDHQEQKALGIALGDIYVAQNNWQWQEYKDAEGKSYGVCVPDTSHCVFPMSMMTRRLRVTHKVNVERLYERGLSLLAPALPKTPYSAEESSKDDTPTEKRIRTIPLL